MSTQKLRLGAIENLKRDIGRGFFTHHSYELAFNNEDGTIVEATFRDDTSFTFHLLQPKSEKNQSTKWKTVESPGRHFAAPENYEHAEFHQAYSAIYNWADRVFEEVTLRAKAHLDKSAIEELRQNIANTADRLPEPDLPFTAEELTTWSARFDKLVSKLHELERSNEIQQGRVEQLSRELAELKRQGSAVPKRTWLKTAGNKVLDLLESTSKSALEALAQGAVKALLEQGKNSGT